MRCLFLELSLALVLASGGVAVRTTEAQGQPPRPPTRVPATLALVETLPGPDDAPFRILRRSGVTPHDVILLRHGADSSDLSDAVRGLVLIRSHTGDTARATGLVRVRRQPGGAPSGGAPVLPWTARVLNDLRAAAPRPVAGVGTVRAIEIWLPPQARRAPSG